MTPYEKLKSIPGFKRFLKLGIGVKDLNKVAYAESDNEFAEKMQKARVELFKNFKHIPQELLTFTTFISGSSID